MGYSNEKSREYYKQIRMQRKMMNECTRCGGQDEYTLNGKALCHSCSDKAKESSRRYRQKHSDSYKKEVKIKLSAARTSDIFEIVRLAESHGMSYGKYMSIYR